MGYIKHHAIVVTDWDTQALQEAHQKAIEIFSIHAMEEGLAKPMLISPIMGSWANSQLSFLIAPDGSKEGWTTSDRGDNARKHFLDWLRDSHLFCDYIEVEFGGDSDYADILRDKDKDMDLKDEER